MRGQLVRLTIGSSQAAERHGTMDAAHVIKAAQAELEVHAGTDEAQRAAAAERARRQLDEAEQLFGSKLRVLRGTA